MDKHIDVPFDSSVSTTLKAGDYVYIDGIVYSARDAAHKRMYDAIMESLQEMQRIKECTKLLKEVKSCLLM